MMIDRSQYIKIHNRHVLLELIKHPIDVEKCLVNKKKTIRTYGELLKLYAVSYLDGTFLDNSRFDIISKYNGELIYQYCLYGESKHCRSFDQYKKILEEENLNVIIYHDVKDTRIFEDRNNIVHKSVDLEKFYEDLKRLRTPERA